MWRLILLLAIWFRKLLVSKDNLCKSLHLIHLSRVKVRKIKKIRTLETRNSTQQSWWRIYQWRNTSRSKEDKTSMKISSMNNKLMITKMMVIMIINITIIKEFLHNYSWIRMHLRDREALRVEEEEDMKIDR